MAEILFTPEWSPYSGIIVSHLQIACAKFQQVEDWFFYNFYKALGELIFCFIPSLFVNILLWTIVISGYSVAWIIWWTMFLRTRWRLLAVDGRTILDILKNPNPEVREYKTRKRVEAILFNWIPFAHARKIKAYAEEQAIEDTERKCIGDSFFEFNNSWCRGVGQFRDEIRYTSEQF